MNNYYGYGFPMLGGPTYFDPGFGGVPIGGGYPPAGGGGWLGGIGDFVGDIRDIVGDVSEVIGIIRGDDVGAGTGTGGFGAGTSLPVPSGGANPFTNLIGNVGGGNSEVLVNSLPNQSAAETSFIDFLRAIGVAASIINWLWENPPYTWPKIAADMFAAWFNAGQPSGPDGTITPLVPPEWKTGTSPSLPTTGTNFPTTHVGGLLPVAMPAVATQVYKAPKGYVTANVPQGNGTSTKMFVQKRVATALGLYKARAKAPITGTEWRAVKKAKRYEQKLAKMLGDSCNFKVTKKR